MQRWALISLVLALLAGLLGFVVASGTVAEMAQFAFGLLLLVCIVLFIGSLFTNRDVSG
ncbi:MAG TPA: hypothetical protein VNT26_22070 [Candidatus Sulfotelmatobacter sp.]|nr:hypothetical protein [Candidatus Sulfotelmatobacter sp.]HWI56482.1 hypothetical protein [Bacillota bacterium]